MCSSDLIKLKIKNRIIYSPHIYPWFQTRTGINYGRLSSYSRFKKELDYFWDFRLKSPIWVGEWGYSLKDHLDPKNYFSQHILRYLKETDIDWAWWPLNVGIKPGSNQKETWGLLEENWKELKKNDVRLEQIKGLISNRASERSPH